MKAMILAAGRGTRLGPLTDTVPKPLLPVRGRPLIEWQLGWLRGAGIDEIVVNLHHLGDTIEETVGDGSRYGVRIRYSREAELLETGGGIVRALPLLGGTFVLLNGDIWTDFEFSTLPRALEQGALAHLVLTPTPPHRARGDFALDGDRVRARGDDYVFCGIAVLSARLFADAPDGPFSWTADHLFARLGRIVVTAQVFEGEWTDIGSIEQYDSVR